MDALVGNVSDRMFIAAMLCMVLVIMLGMCLTLLGAWMIMRAAGL